MISGDDEQPLDVERGVSLVLFWGGVTAIALVVIGLVLYIASGVASGTVIDLGAVFTRRAEGRPPQVFVSIPEIVRDVARWPSDPLAVVALGLVVLMLTPVASVAVALAGFLRARDRQYVIVTGLVLTALVLSFLFGRGPG